MNTKISETIETIQEDEVPAKNSINQRPSKSKAPRFSRRIKKGFKAICSNERTTLNLEKYIPELAKVATIKAYRRAIMSGSRVVIAQDGELKEVLPDGTTRNLKKLEPSVNLQKGRIIKIK